jgi:hypothetical protein
MKAIKNHSTKTMIIPTVLARALHWWYKYPNAPASRQLGRIIRHEYPNADPYYLMLEIIEGPRKSE